MLELKPILVFLRVSVLHMFYCTFLSSVGLFAKINLLGKLAVPRLKHFNPNKDTGFVWNFLVKIGI